MTTATASSSSSPSGPVVARPPIQTRRTVDCKPLSSVHAHHAPITALCLAHNQSILFTGDSHGLLCVWRVFTERHERNRPPLSSAPLASFPIHEGKVVSISSNTYVGVAVSIARDMQDTRGCEMAVFSVRGGSARFIRTQIAVDPDTDWQMVVLTSSSNIVLYGSQAGVATLWCYTLNGQLLATLATGEVLNVLYATPATAKTTAYEGFVVTGGRKGVVVFRNPTTLEPVQSFFCDDLYPQSIAHGGQIAAAAATPVAAPVAAAAATSASAVAASAPPASVPDLWDGSSFSDTGSPTVAATPTAATAAPAAAAPTPTSAPLTAPSSVDPLETAAMAAHTDPMIASLVKDCSLSIRMGVAAFDIAPSQQHFVVAMYPDPFPPVPQQMEMDEDSPNASSVTAAAALAAPQAPAHIEGRLLLFPLPHSLQDSSNLGFYLEYGWSTLESVRDALSNRMSDTRDALSNRMSDTRDLARERIEAAKEKWNTNASKATAQLAVAKSKIFSAFSGFFSKKPAAGPPPSAP